MKKTSQEAEEELFGEIGGVAAVEGMNMAVSGDGRAGAASSSCAGGDAEGGGLKRG